MSDAEYTQLTHTSWAPHNDPLGVRRGIRMGLVNPHGKARKLRPLLLSGPEQAEARQAAQALPQVRITSREASDLVMLGIGAFTPLDGFMGQAEWPSIFYSFITA